MRFVWATAEHSLFELADTLDKLNVSYSVKHGGKETVVNNGHSQPKWVHLSSDLTSIKKNSVNFISSSYAELSLTNYPMFSSPNLYEHMKSMLVNPARLEEVIVRKMGVMDYVNSIAKPSLLNKIQTVIYKIQPYSLRKETQALVLDYFCSRISERKMLHTLRRSFKTAGLIPLIEQGSKMRDAVAQVASIPVELISEQTGIPTFELLYLSKQRKKPTDDASGSNNKQRRKKS